MVDTDTFLTVLYVMADDFCKRQPQHRPTPGPKASLTESEVITLVIFSQCARFRSERDFYRYATSRLRNPDGFLPMSGRPVAGTPLPLRSVGQFRRSHKRRETPGRRPSASSGGWPDRLILAGATAWAGMKAFTCCFPSIPKASSPVSALPRPAPRTRHWPRISSPSGILPTPGCPPWGRRLWAGMWRTRALRAGSGISGGGTATAPG